MNANERTVLQLAVQTGPYMRMLMGMMRRAQAWTAFPRGR